MMEQVLYGTIIYAEINLVCILILVLLSVKVNQSMFLQEQRRLFFRVAVSNAVFLMIDCLWIFAERSELQIGYSANWLINGSYYMLSGALGYFWFVFSETVQDSKLVRNKRYRLIAMLPVAALVILTIASFWNGWLFYIDQDNQYQRGPAYVIQLITSYGYVIFTAVKAFYLSFKTEDYRKKKELKILATFVLPTLITGGLQVLLPGYPILCIGNTFGMLYIYLTLQEQLISLDALTKLNNRNQLFQYLSVKMSHPHENKNLYLIMMDVDYFKSINDKYGHVEGDRALKIVANCLMKACSTRNYFIARYGGDEFVVLCELELDGAIDAVCSNIRHQLESVEVPYRLSLSFGYARYTTDIKTQQEFVEHADKELYKVKMHRPAR